MLGKLSSAAEQGSAMSYGKFQFACICYTLLISCAMAAPNNGGFELFDYNSTIGINTPAGWNTDNNYTAVVNHLTPRDSRWKLKKDLLPFNGNSFLLLGTGKENVLRKEPNQANVWQTITVNAGDKLTGVFFFGTLDYYPYLDWAEIKLGQSPLVNLNLSSLMLVHVTAGNVGSFDQYDAGSMSGWKRFEHTFTPEEAGTYTLIIRVCDYGDSEYDSFFAVDSFVLCRNPAQAGDFSCDCTVNFEDFVYLANDWLCNCKDPNVHNDPQSDPNYYNDPNSNCLLGTDLTGNGPVNTNDFRIMSEHWLEGIKE
jgi:hypothetical protein